MRSFLGIPIFSCLGCPSPLSSRLSQPLLAIPGQNRPGNVHPVAGMPIVSTLSHPMIGLEMGNHRFDSCPEVDQPLEPPGVFQRSPDFAFFGNGTFGMGIGPEEPFQPEIRISGPPPTSSAAFRSPFSIRRGPPRESLSLSGCRCARHGLPLSRALYWEEDYSV